MTGIASAQAPAKITIGIYAPSVQFDTAQARLAYVQGLAKAVEQSTGIKTEAQSYATLASLKKDSPDFAIIDGQCYATNQGWKLLANATIGGSTSRQWALYTSAGESMQALKGKKLAYVQTGCNDAGFIDNAMLESEVDAGFFGARVGQNDLTGAVASVSSYKTAQAVFAPSGAVKGLTKLFDTGNVPNPAFVEIGNKTSGISDKVAAAVVSYGGSGAISGWTKPSQEPFSSLRNRLGQVKKQGVFANPEGGVRVNASNVVIDPVSLKDPAYVSVRYHFVRAPAGRME
ncbi:MAG TPA: hypothetical protein VIV40_22315 [Kofleriaceae bacterium]